MLIMSYISEAFRSNTEYSAQPQWLLDPAVPKAEYFFLPTSSYSSKSSWSLPYKPVYDAPNKRFSLNTAYIFSYFSQTIANACL